MGQTGTALTSIVTQVTEISGIVAEIAASTQEQATALQEVNSAINQMDEVVQKNAAMVEQTTAATQVLANDAENLTRSIGLFELGGQATRLATARPAKPARPTPRQTATVMKTAGRGGAAPKPQAAVEADWQEF